MAALAAEHEDSEFNVTPGAAYVVLVLAAVILLHPTAFIMVKAWATSSSFHHGFFVAPIALWMIRTTNESVAPSGSSLPGYLIVILGAALWLFSRAAGIALTEQAGFITLLIGMVGIVYGAGSLQRWAFPLLFLYFMIPFGETIIPALQTATAEIVIALLSAIQMPVSLDGYIITTPAGDFTVAEACAGLRFLIAAMMISSLYAYLSFASWAKRFSFLAFALMVAVIANGVRAFLLVLIATLTNKEWAIGPDHVLIGWLFYALIFLVLVLVGQKFADKTPNEWRTAEVEKTNEPSPWSAVPALAILVFLAIYTSMLVERPVHRETPAALTLFNAPGWRILPPPQNWQARLSSTDRTVGATYKNTSHTVYVSVGYITHDRADAELVTTSNRSWDGRYWSLAGQHKDAVYLFGQSETANFSLLTGPNRRKLATLTGYWLDQEIYFNPLEVKFAQMKAKLRGDNPSGGVIILAASYSTAPQEAVTAIRAFTSEVEEFDAWLSRNSGR
ncbi:MAG: exosortase A [Hyphococcus sp.]|nr:MAG: exosortase A [Marinicaulis sp.]